MKTIAIIDYGMGNLGSVAAALTFLGRPNLISGDRRALARADAFILPGVGAFAMAMKNLQSRKLIDVLTEQVMEEKKPMLGICLGMQLLAKSSTELGQHAGLGWFDAKVVGIESKGTLKVPHVGWNDVEVVTRDPMFARISAATPHFYFDHSYHFECDAPVVTARTLYGSSLIAAVAKGNVWATQFHPEKSQVAGLKLLRSFANFADSC